MKLNVICIFHLFSNFLSCKLFVESKYTYTELHVVLKCNRELEVINTACTVHVVLVSVCPVAIMSSNFGTEPHCAHFCVHKHVLPYSCLFVGL